MSNYSRYSRDRDMKILGVFDRLVPSTRQLIYNLHSPTYLHCKYVSILAGHFAYGSLIFEIGQNI